jgi:hypothetical protein
MSYGSTVKSWKYTYDEFRDASLSLTGSILDILASTTYYAPMVDAMTIHPTPNLRNRP